MHAKERAIAPPFRRVIGAEVKAVTTYDHDELGAFSGEVRRPDALVETALLKAEMVFKKLDVDCALASEGSYGPIDRLPLNPGGVEILAFIDRKRGIRLIETLTTHRTNWRLQRFEAGNPERLVALEGMGFPGVGGFVGCNSDLSHPVKGL